MSELYLIAHKVRGQPAFDIAHQIEVEDEVWWIIPTSGHRAYPYWHKELCKIMVAPEIVLNALPPDLEDHYTVRADPSAPRPTGSSLLAALGLGAPKRPTVARRI